ncbi:MAG: hypothetical protein N2Z68_01600 [Patescibacteria group bacterium]|nr:hypothetical protein [Patescibacteria group bacterium]
MLVSLRTVLIFLAFIALIYFPTVIEKWYLDYPWVDIPLHFLGGGWGALLFFFFFGSLFSEERGANHPWERVRILILAIAFASFVGVFWEFGEFILNQYFSVGMEQSIPDTMGDLFLDILGALTFGLFLIRRKI